MKTLIVSYLPRGARSHTKKLRDAFLENMDSEEIEYLDLMEDVPDLFMSDSVMAYIKRNYLGEELSVKEKKAMAKMDRMTRQLKKADVVVLATPMYNFSFPAAVKAWFDSVMLKGETWDAGKGGYIGMMKGKKALLLMASGGAYDKESSSYEHAVSLAKVEFGFMGFTDVRAVTAEGMNMVPDKDKVISDAQEEVRRIVKEWYG
ncbi:MAG: NAD(P)H-dependent oxidoreductase [archaeon]